MIHDAVQEFAKLPFADGKVLRLSLDGGEICAHCLDWQNRAFCVRFSDVIGYEVFSIEGEDLSHGTVNSTDPFIKRASKVAQDDEEGLWCFAVWSAWSDEALMRVVARGFRVEMDT